MSSGLDIAPPPVLTAPARERRTHWFIDGLKATLPAWIVAHLVVFTVSWHMSRHHPLAKLFMWDTRWYLTITAHGYDRAGGLVHFFPLTPMTAAAITAVTRVSPTIALFGLCWAAALAFGVLVHRITVRETGDVGAARRAAWLTQLAPGAYALVMGYTEPLAGLLAAAYFLAVRAYPDRAARWWAAIPLGFFSGLARPIGFLLALPGGFEGLRAARAAGRRPGTAVKALLAAGSPFAGLFAYLAYSKVRFHRWMLPFTQQTEKLNRGHVINNPVHAFTHEWVHGWHGSQVASMAVLLIAVFAVLVAVLARRLPAAYLVWTLPMFVLAITSKDFTSLPRYVGALFPALIAAALLARRRWQEAVLIAVSVALLVWTSHIALAAYLVA
jgi:hypothetical protein